MEFQQIIYQPGTVARIVLNRPAVRNVQSRILIEEMDAAFARAEADPDVRVIVLSGAGEHFSAGHDLGTPEETADRESRGFPTDPTALYLRRKSLYLDAPLRWRNILKPTLAMVHGYCIFGGWLIASAMDLIFAAEDARFLPSPNLQYFSAPWDLGARKALELLYEVSFITGRQAHAYGLVNRVYPAADLERETLAYAERVAENDPTTLRRTKLAVLQSLDTMGFTGAVTATFHSRFGPSELRGPGGASDGQRSMPGVRRALERLWAERAASLDDAEASTS
jgi:enoyl-CoA hydratase